MNGIFFFCINNVNRNYGDESIFSRVFYGWSIIDGKILRSKKEMKKMDLVSVIYFLKKYVFRREDI